MVSTAPTNTIEGDWNWRPVEVRVHWVEVAGYRKATHTEKYLAFDSHHPEQSKAAVVKTLLDRAEAIPSNANKRKSEKENVLKDLKINGYTSHFIDNACEEKRNRQDQLSEPRSYIRVFHM